MKLGLVARRMFMGSLILYFALPMIALGRFAFQTVPVVRLNWSTIGDGWTFDSIGRAFTNEGVLKSLVVSLELTGLTALLTLAVLVPITVYVEIAKPALKPLMTGLTILPWLVPPVALVVGVAATFRQVMPAFLSSPLSLTFFYVLWMLPFTYRAFEGQLRLMGVRNLYEAAQSLGCRPMKFFWTVVLPNLKTALLVSITLIIASVLGEYTFAALLLKQTLPVYMLSYQTEDVRAGFALALIVMVMTALLIAVSVAKLRKRGLNFSVTGI